MIGAVVVGILHMSAPDNWLTLCFLAKNRKWTPQKLLGTSFATAIGHVTFSIVMGLVVVAIGLLVSHLISFYVDIGIGAIMIVVGVVLGIVPLLRKNNHHEHEHENMKKNQSKLSQKIGYFTILVAAVSPDPA